MGEGEEAKDAEWKSGIEVTTAITKDITDIAITWHQLSQRVTPEIS